MSVLIWRIRQFACNYCTHFTVLLWNMNILNCEFTIILFHTTDNIITKRQFLVQMYSIAKFATLSHQTNFTQCLVWSPDTVVTYSSLIVRNRAGADPEKFERGRALGKFWTIYNVYRPILRPFWINISNIFKHPRPFWKIIPNILKIDWPPPPPPPVLIAHCVTRQLSLLRIMMTSDR